MNLYNHSSNNPIGIFDSGIGGLTVAHAVQSLLPNEQLIYFGDTAHLPYGEKSTAALQSYSIKAVDFLLKQHCKVILIACNSASAAAYELVREYTASRAKIIDVINPIVDHVASHFQQQKVGLIGTRQTVNSGVYTKKLQTKNQQIEFCALATPLLASMIEEGFFNDNISKSVIAEYLSDKTLENIDGLILGCTHYPLIKKDIQEFFEKTSPKPVEIIDGSFIVAESLKTYLVKNNLLNESKKREDAFYVSDFTQSFEETTRIFFNKPVELELYKLWE